MSWTPVELLRQRLEDLRAKRRAAPVIELTDADLSALRTLRLATTLALDFAERHVRPSTPLPQDVWTLAPEDVLTPSNITPHVEADALGDAVGWLRDIVAPLDPSHTALPYDLWLVGQVMRGLGAGLAGMVDPEDCTVDESTDWVALLRHCAAACFDNLAVHWDVPLDTTYLAVPADLGFTTAGAEPPEPTEEEYSDRWGLVVELTQTQPRDVSSSQLIWLGEVMQVIAVIDM